LYFQGIYYLITGIWPILDIDSFQSVTGPKTDHLQTGRQSDHWLVITVGVLVMAIALSLLTAAWKKRISVEIVVLAISSATGLLLIDVIFVRRGVIAEIYLLDAWIEGFLILAWLYCGMKSSSLFG
jgi:hypothetical protein